MSRSIRIAFQRMTRRTMRSLLRVWMRINRQDRYGRAGFVLPTVVMVLLVVVLLTITIMLRSMDRAKMAQYRRVDEQVLQAATPALDRAKAKIEYLLSGKGKETRETPSDDVLSRALNDPSYNLGDEQRLQIQYEIDDIAGITVIKDGTNFKPLEDQDAIQTAWRFPVDTNNDGKFDSFTYYGIFFRKPGKDIITGKDRTRNPLDARTPPMPPSSGISKQCQAVLASGGTSGLVDDWGWSRLDGNLKKAFFVYTTTVPITLADISSSNLIKNSQNQLVFTSDKYSQFQGTPSFSALEYQLDFTRVPLTNNAVVYEDDLIINPVTLNLNGRIFTNSNLIASPSNTNNNLKLYQVSGINSCFYKEENSKVIVAGNVINGITDKPTENYDVQVHLYQGAGTRPTSNQKITNNNQSVSTAVNSAMYDDAAYKDRLSALINDLRATPGVKGTDIVATNMPPSIEKVVQKRITEDTTLKPDTVREEELRAYFKARIRKVTQAEVKTIPAKGAVATGLGSEALRPATDTWMLPTNAAGTVSTSSGLTFRLNQLQQTEPETQKKNEKENYLGDRVIAGNNLPALTYDSTIDTRWKAAANLPITGQKWTAPNTVPRTRSTQVKPLPNLGDTKRDGYWEKAAAQKPKAPLDAIGGLRVITGAGIYERKNSFLPPPQWVPGAVTTYDDPATSATEKFPIVWPDTMPMSPVTGVAGVKVYDNSVSPGSWYTFLPTDLSLPAAQTPTIDPNTPQYAKGDLRMRASVVYHYASDPYDPANSDTDQQPIACVSNYYDPTNRITAKNLIDVDGGLGKDTTNGKSNNGVAYPKPTTARPTAASYSATTGLYTVSGGAAELGNQANYVFPDGRFANSALRDALKTLVAGDDLTLANQAAIDSALCSLDILSDSITPSDPSDTIPHGAIREVTFLNAREVKANEPDEPTTTVDETFTLSSPPNTAQKAQLNARATLPLEERMPQEVRATRIDLELLANQPIAQSLPVKEAPQNNDGKEYLLPFSGIIYASRDDALPDLSAQPSTINSEADLEESAADLKLDPTRRPNGILLAGDVLKRPLPASPTVQQVVQDKGLTLVSNLPVYIQGVFNKHTQSEFTGTFSWTFNDYYDRAANKLNPNFACHANDPRIQSATFKCDTGDDWRPANVLADAITLLSDNFRFGYRDEGDFDLRNNAGSALILRGGSWVSAKTARLENGFLNNDYAINGLSNGLSGGLTTGRFDIDDNGDINGADATPVDLNYRSTTGTILNSSYFNNFVTPVQRRLDNDPKEFLTEICLKLPVSACDPDDWKVIDKDDPTLRTASELINNASGTDDYSLIDGSGTTATPPDPKYQRFPRRVAFKRDTATATNPYKLILNGDLPIPLGVKGTEIIEATFADTNTTPDTKPNALWFQTRNGTDRSSTGTNPLWYYDPTTPATSATFVEPENKQPLLVPILQIHATDSTDTATAFPVGADVQANSRWVIQAKDTEFNLVMATGDIPARPGDNNGGLQNLPRFLENWQNPERTATIAGAFIQTNRSSYASAPYFSVMDTDAAYDYAQRPPGMFGNTSTDPKDDSSKYRSDAGSGKIGYFLPPTRNWGFDVGLLSQPPDLFAQKFSLPDEIIDPDEYFREVSRDDDWVKGLLCSKVAPLPTATPGTISTTKAIPGQICPAKYGS
ncbi:hormogonium polysaccharide biosynthesis protein HpsA [Planktothrix agardhii]|uniref:hormogonium polysaccharide biosynthesis protein HpsA n=1 Tax=Planktothrix agardhii TaxID=1160 RepID=UPI001F452ADE|nr:hormogonium polysaccharide biosynthesis protein HpsA [Planktothrix agardhii]MCF3564557.1 hormogonium polysaccharide biosynthesis protein HpsA [Planktothrix agardhii 1807]